MFGRKKESKADEKSAEVSGAFEQQVSPATKSDPVYAPSPWDEHQTTDGTAPEAGIVARAGKPLQPGVVVATQKAIAEALKTVLLSLTKDSHPGIHCFNISGLFKACQTISLLTFSL